MSSVDEIQNLLGIYAERKNAQGGCISYSTLRVTETKPDKTLVQIQGTSDEGPFKDWQSAHLVYDIFFPLMTQTQNDVSCIDGSHKQIIDALSAAIDRIVVYPQTEHLQKILVAFDISFSKNNPPAVLPYPHQARPLNQFRECDMRGIHVYDSQFIDTSSPAEGVIVHIPYCQYDEASVADAAKSVLVVAKAGFRLPFLDSSINRLEREVTAGRSRHARYFPQMAVPSDGKVGFNSLSGFTPNGNLCFAIMEDPDTVAARLAMLASKLDGITCPVLDQMPSLK